MTDTSTSSPHKDWNIIYPIYIDKAYSQGKGRRIAKEFAIDAPTAAEIAAVITSLQLPCALETTKRHCATPRTLGRIRFLLKNEADELYNTEIDNKQTLLLLIAGKIAAQRTEKALKAPQPQTAQQGKGGKKRR